MTLCTSAGTLKAGPEKFHKIISMEDPDLRPHSQDYILVALKQYDFTPLVANYIRKSIKNNGVIFIIQNAIPFNFSQGDCKLNKPIEAVDPQEKISSILNGITIINIFPLIACHTEPKGTIVTRSLDSIMVTLPHPVPERAIKFYDLLKRSGINCQYSSQSMQSLVLEKLIFVNY